MTTAARQIHPILLSGGAGVRLWPMSRQFFPKQLLPLASDKSMIQETALRVADKNRFAEPLVICNEEHRFIIAEHLRQIGQASAGIVLEPVGRNTAAAAAVAALWSMRTDPEALVLILPADHVITDVPAFLAAVDDAAALAEQGFLVTFGIRPASPETGYGYIQQGDALPSSSACRIARFIEKPTRAVAEELLDAGDCFWNSGMFLFRADRYLAELERFEPGILDACRKAIEKGARDLDFFRLERDSFAGAKDISIDYAVMERTAEAAMIPADIGWTDVGTWAALWEIGGKDDDGNVCIGDVMIESGHNCYVRSEGVLTTVLGLDDIVVVATDDAVLVSDRGRAQDIKPLVERLKAAGRSEPKTHLRVHRPWGFYQSLHAGDRFQVKRLTVNPGAKLSLQKHYHRAEHWVVVNGTALVTRNDEQILLRENESIYIPLGAVHRLENPGKVTLNLIEIQSGSYLGEDDIVRIEDIYSRS